MLILIEPNRRRSQAAGRCFGASIFANPAKEMPPNRAEFFAKTSKNPAFCVFRLTPEFAARSQILVILRISELAL